MRPESRLVLDTGAEVLAQVLFPQRSDRHVHPVTRTGHRQEEAEVIGDDQIIAQRSASFDDSALAATWYGASALRSEIHRLADSFADLLEKEGRVNDPLVFRLIAVDREGAGAYSSTGVEA